MRDKEILDHFFELAKEGITYEGMYSALRLARQDERNNIKIKFQTMWFCEVCQESETCCELHKEEFDFCEKFITEKEKS
jgi:hypothetical protein